MSDEMKVERFEVDVIGDVCGPRFEMVRHPQGGWVEYTDYADLQQQLAAAREDSRRIDWIALQGDEFVAGVIVDAPGDGDYYAHGHRRGVYGTGKTFRDAVDAAISAEAAIDATLQRDRQP